MSIINRVREKNAAGFWASNVDVNGEVLTGADLRGARIRDLRATRTNLQKADLSGTRFILGSFDSADLTSVRADHAQWSDVNAHMCHAPQINLEHASLRIFAEFSEFKNARLQGCRLIECEFSGCSFRGANFKGARIRGGAFRAARLEGAKFEGAWFVSADLRGAHFDDEAFAQAMFPFTVFSPGTRPIMLHDDAVAAFDMLMMARAHIHVSRYDDSNWREGLEKILVAIPLLDEARLVELANEARFQAAHFRWMGNDLHGAYELLEELEPRLENDLTDHSRMLRAFVRSLKAQMVPEDLHARIVLMRQCEQDSDLVSVAVLICEMAIHQAFDFEGEEGLPGLEIVRQFRGHADPDVRYRAGRAWYTEGLNLAAAQREEEACETLLDFAKACADDPFLIEHWQEAVFHAAEAMLAAGQFERAIEIYKNSLDPERPQAFTGMSLLPALANCQIGDILTRSLHRRLEAWPYLLEASSHADTEVDDLTTRAIECMALLGDLESRELGRLHQGAQRLHLATVRAQAFPDDDRMRATALTAIGQRARLHFDSGEYHEAQALADEGIDLYGHETSDQALEWLIVAHTDRGMIRRELGDIDGAVEDYERAFEIAIHNPWVATDRRWRAAWGMVDAGWILSKAERWDEGIPRFERLVEEYADDLESHVRSEVGWALILCGDAHVAMGRTGAAIEAWRRIREFLYADETWGNARAAYAASLLREAEHWPEGSADLYQEFASHFLTDSDPEVQKEVATYHQRHAH
jgi:tetratricopeptide (TPR) repeat protein